MKLASRLARLLLALISLATAARVAFAAPPQEIYTLNCWGCHQPHAEGIPGTVPRLAGSMGYFLNVPEGRAYIIEVPGVAASPLTDAEVAQVTNWLLQTFSKDQLPRDFKPYTAEEVSRLRPHQLTNVIDTRAALVKELAALGYRVPDQEVSAATAISTHK